MTATIILTPSSRPLVYPNSIVSLIVEQLGNVSVIQTGSPSSERNGTLLLVALTNQSWSKAAVSLLYSDLRLKWRASVILPLLKAFEERPDLLERVVRVEVSYPSTTDLEKKILRDSLSKADREALRLEWLEEKWRRSLDESVFDDWRREQLSLKAGPVHIGSDRDWVRTSRQEPPPFGTSSPERPTCAISPWRTSISTFPTATSLQ